MVVSLPQKRSRDEHPPPSFHARIPFDQCVHLAWAVALGQPVNVSETRSISTHLEDLSAIFGQGELPPDFSGYWLEEERAHCGAAIALPKRPFAGGDRRVSDALAPRRP
jgi:hypothetical protein